MRGAGVVRKVVVLALLVATACQKKPPAPADAGAVVAATEDEDRRRFRDAWVYVDGTPVRVMKYRELPPSLPTTVVPLVGGKNAMRFSLAGYLRALGLDLARVRQVHLHGGRSRVCVLQPADIARLEDSLLFQFTQQTRGKPQMTWPDVELKADRIDLITALAVYVDKAPPVLEAVSGKLVLSDGTRVDGPAYVTEQDAGGTRVYLDGKLMALMRRPGGGGGGGGGGRGRGAGGTTEMRPLGPYLASVGVPLAAVRHVRVVDNDEVLADISGAVTSAEVQYGLPARSRGRMVVRAPARDGGSDLMASVIELWTLEQPPERATVQ